MGISPIAGNSVLGEGSLDITGRHLRAWNLGMSAAMSKGLKGDKALAYATSYLEKYNKFNANLGVETESLQKLKRNPALHPQEYAAQNVILAAQRNANPVSSLGSNIPVTAGSSMLAEEFISKQSKLNYYLTQSLSKPGYSAELSALGFEEALSKREALSNLLSLGDIHAKNAPSNLKKQRENIRKFESAKRAAGIDEYASGLLHQLGDPDSELNKKLKGEKSSKQKKAEIDIVAKGTERGMKKIGAGRTGSLVSMADFIAAGRLINKAFGGFVGREMGAASYSQSLINASALTGSDPVTIAKYRFALKTFGGSDASADSLFKAINNLVQGSLVGESSPWFRLASMYGFNLTGSGTGAMLTEDEMLERLRDYFTSKERSAREKAHFASGAGLDAAAIRLFSSSDKTYSERLGSQYVLREEEIEALAETQERFTTLMEKFSTTMSRIVGEHGVLDYWIEKGEALNALLDKWISRDTNTQQPGLPASKSISKWERFWLSDDERKQLYGTDARLRFGIPGGMFGIDKLLFDYQLGDDILDRRYRMTPDGNRIKIDLEVKDSNGDKLDSKQTSYFSADSGIEVVIA